MQLDETFAQFPSPLRREWSIAQGRLLESTMLTDQEKTEFKELEGIGGEEIEEAIAKQAYDNVMTRLNKRQSQTESQMGNNLFEDLLLEKSYDLDKFRVDRDTTESKKTLDQLSDQVLTKGQSFKNSKLNEYDLDGLADETIQARIDELMDRTLDAGETDQSSQVQQNEVLSSLKDKVIRRPGDSRRRRMKF